MVVSHKALLVMLGSESISASRALELCVALARDPVTLWVARLLR
ncbi:hypothetical protein A2U01_0106985, partial [Trifolium medium]|nr:hypothetical protein [Trifolium medium]